MAVNNSKNLLTTPVYQIIVQGAMPEDIYNYFEGMDIKVYASKSGNRYSMISGQVKDQSALIGMINMLYDFHFVISSIVSSIDD